MSSGRSWLLYQTVAPPSQPLPPGVNPLGTEVRRIITEWAAASGRDLKQRNLPIRVLPAMPSALTRR